jgi:hypothetical protein
MNGTRKPHGTPFTKVGEERNELYFDEHDLANLEQSLAEALKSRARPEGEGWLIDLEEKIPDDLLAEIPPDLLQTLLNKRR